MSETNDFSFAWLYDVLRYIKDWVIYSLVKKKGGGQSWTPFIHVDKT